MAPVSAYYEPAQQFILPHLHNSFINIWDYDSQSPTDKVSIKEKVTAMNIYDNSVLVVGTKTGALQLHELPSGILLRRVHLHSNEIISLEVENGYLITASHN